MTYHTVHQLHRDAFSISFISKYLVMDWRTVKKYLSMTEHEYEQFLESQSERKKGLEDYEGFVKSRLAKYPMPRQASTLCVGLNKRLKTARLPAVD